MHFSYYCGAVQVYHLALLYIVLLEVNNKQIVKKMGDYGSAAPSKYAHVDKHLHVYKL